MDAGPFGAVGVVLVSPGLAHPVEGFAGGSRGLLRRRSGSCQHLCSKIWPPYEQRESVLCAQDRAQVRSVLSGIMETV
jgi:hypothetical protein